jgi:hypothetical protein
MSEMLVEYDQKEKKRTKENTQEHPQLQLNSCCETA